MSLVVRCPLSRGVLYKGFHCNTIVICKTDRPLHLLLKLEVEEYLWVGEIVGEAVLLRDNANESGAHDRLFISSISLETIITFFWWRASLSLKESFSGDCSFGFVPFNWPIIINSYYNN